MSHEKSSARVDIEKFNGANYSRWAHQVQMVLRSKDLWVITSQGRDAARALEDPEATEAQLDRTLRLKDDKALALISLALEPAYQSVVRGLDTAEQAWDAMQETFRANSVANRMVLHRRFYGVRMKESDKVASHWHTMLTLRDELAGAGTEISDLNFAYVLLASLPPSFDTLVTSLEVSADENRLRLANLKQILLLEEAKHADSAVEGEAKVLAAAPTSVWETPKTKKPKSNKKQPKQESKGAGSQANAKPKKEFKGACWNCGEAGHRANQCSKPKKDAEILVAGGDEDSKGNNDHLWVVDSGASHHIKSDAVGFEQYVQFVQPRPIAIANNATIQAVGVGHVSEWMCCPYAGRLPRACVPPQSLFGRGCYQARKRRHLHSGGMCDSKSRGRHSGYRSFGEWAVSIWLRCSAWCVPRGSEHLR
jgi:hypothetical protein